MPFDASDDDTQTGGGTSTAPANKVFALPIRIAKPDEPALAAADALLTLSGTTTLPGVAGTYYVSLSAESVVPVYP